MATEISGGGVKISVKVKILTPFNGSGVAQSPWQKEEITVV